jgi:polyphosphate kinase 2 (PPK2 family)
MSKRKDAPVAGRDYELLDNGVIAVRRCFSCVAEPYNKKDKPRAYLSLVDHTVRIKKKGTYKRALCREEVRFNKLVRKLQEQKRALIIVLQGRDGAGKSGAAERLLHAVDYDHKIFLWIPIGPPTEDEKAHPYLWRFFTGERMPKFGQVRVFDRSWYERVLVEPVMKLTPRADIKRSYSELRSFDWLLTSQGAIVVKFWLDISKDEQLRRFKARAASKPWKISPSDKEARKHWEEYTEAANEMFHRTGTDFAPWYIVSSEDKWYSRVTVLQTINNALKEALD